MALSGLHVVCGFAGIDGYDNAPQPIITKVVWSEAPATATQTTNAAPAADALGGAAIFRVWSTADCYVSIGQVPNASASPRHFVPASTFYDIGVGSGDRLAWVAA